MKKIIVTGGAGFLGRHLCEKLLQDENNDVTCLDNYVTGCSENVEQFLKNPRFHNIYYDITKPFPDDYLPNVDEIYHLACIASPPKYKEYSIETLNTSFNGTQNILNLAKKNGAKVLFTSTSEVYGDPLVHPQPEEYFGNVNTVGERSCYDEGKRVAESLIYEYRRKFNMDIKIVRIFNTYGPYMDIDDGRVITNFIKQIIEKKTLYIYGNGEQTRSFCYVSDMINGLYKMMNSQEKGPINIGNPNCEFTLNQLILKFEKIIGNKLSVIYLDATENDPKQRKPIIEKAQKLLDWNPTINLESGLLNTFDYFTSTTSNNPYLL